MPTLALLDGHNLAYRAFYALPSDLATPAGQVTNAVFGFTSMLLKLLADDRPDAIAVTWDVRGGHAARKALYPEYKAQRERPPDLFSGQLPLIDEVLQALDIRQISAEGYEADDVIATLADRARAGGWKVNIVSGDRDVFQLVDDDVHVHYIRRGIADTVTADPEWVTERYGIPPGLYRDYAALRGDTSDNLPGVPGVGEKTATRLIADYGSLEGVYSHLDELSPRLRQNLADHEEQAFLNREIMGLARDVPVEDVALADLLIGEWDRDRVRRVFDDLAFRGLWDRFVELGGESAVEAEEIDVDVRTVATADEIRGAAVDGLLSVAPVHDGGALAGVAVAGSGRAYFVPAARLNLLQDALTGEGAPHIVGHDVKPLLRELIEHDILIDTVGFDTALAAYVVNPAQRAPDLEELAYRELGLAVTPVSEAVPAASQGSFDFEGSAASGPDIDGAARRAEAVIRLVPPLRDQLGARGSEELLSDIELPLVPVLARMEENGIAVDRAFLEKLGDDLRRRLAELEAGIHEAAGEVFNINSTLQLRSILFDADKLGLPVVEKTPKGVPSTSASVLEKLSDAHPMVALLLQYRELEKLRSTYVDALLPLIEPDGRVRGRFNQMAAATGRLSQEQPNLQNIPVRSEEGRIIRQAFVATPGHHLLVADYSQIELRILAHLSGDPGLVDAFANDLDIHTATAARVAGIDPSEVDVDARRRAKVINFGLLYGMEAYGLAQRLGVSREEATEHIDAYFDRFSEVKAFMRGIVEEARRNGYTTTLLGRRRYLPELMSGNFRDRQMGERMALNAPIQGAAADIIKKAMIVLDRRLREAGSGAEMLLQIHDELVLEVPDAEAVAVRAMTVETMENIVELRVPLRVDAASGANLAECKG